MFEAFHKSEKEQLNAFVLFIQNNGLAKHLKEAQELSDAGKSPIKPLDKFADAYNGSGHKRYDLKIAAAYDAEKTKRNGYETKPVVESKTVQGDLTATVGTVGAGIATAKQMLDSVAEVKEGATEVIDKATQQVTSSNNYVLWLIIGFLILAQFGVFTSLWARIKDRLTGRNL